jgi:GTP-binding protein
MPEIEILSHRLPMVAIVGRPNVGKSTLFNRVVGRRKAVVLDTPGVTRDRNFESTEWNGRPFTLVDTGGYETEPRDATFEQMRRHSLIAVEEADLVIFLTDVRETQNPIDLDVARILRRAGKPLIVAVNKCDNAALCHEASAFYTFGFDHLFAITALTGTGVADMLDCIVDLLPTREEGEQAPHQGIRIAVIGRPNVGKSSLVNALLKRERVIVNEMPGTTRDPIDTTFRVRRERPAHLPPLATAEPAPDGPAAQSLPEGFLPRGEDKGEEDGDLRPHLDMPQPDTDTDTDMGTDVDIDMDTDTDEEALAAADAESAGAEAAAPSVPEWQEYRTYTIIDTAGLRRRGRIEVGPEKGSAILAQHSLQRCDVAIVMIDAVDGLTEQDQHIAGFAHDAFRPLIIVVNKWDAIEKDTKTADQLAKSLREEMGYVNYAPILTLSAKTGQRVDRLLPLIDKVYDESMKEIATPALNRWLAESTHRLSPPTRHGRQLRIKYAAQVGKHPPTFALFVNDPELMHFSYQRYLTNRLREQFGFEGVPIRLDLRKKKRMKGEEDED